MNYSQLKKAAVDNTPIKREELIEYLEAEHRVLKNGKWVLQNWAFTESHWTLGEESATQYANGKKVLEVRIEQ